MNCGYGVPCSNVTGCVSVPFVLRMSYSIAPGTARLLYGRPKPVITGTPLPGAATTPVSDGDVSCSSPRMPGEVRGGCAKQSVVAVAFGWQRVARVCCAKIPAGLKGGWRSWSEPFENPA